METIISFSASSVLTNWNIKKELGCQVKLQKQTKSVSAYFFSLVYVFSKWSVICFLLRGHITIFATSVIYLSSWTSDRNQLGRTNFKLKGNLKGSEGGDGKRPWEGNIFLGGTKIHKYIIGSRNGATKLNSLNAGSDGIIYLFFIDDPASTILNKKFKLTRNG